MIYGVEAGNISEAPVFSGRGLFNFQTGTYSWDGTSLAASDVTDKTAWLGAGGLEVPESQGSASIIYSATQSFLAAAQFSIVFDVQILTDSQAFIFRMTSASEDVDVWLKWWGSVEAYEVAYTPNRDVLDTSVWEQGTYRIAMTRVDSRLSISVNGDAVTTDTSPTVALPMEGYPITVFHLGDDAGGIKIHSMKLYDAQADGDLPALGA